MIHLSWVVTRETAKIREGESKFFRIYRKAASLYEEDLCVLEPRVDSRDI